MSRGKQGSRYGVSGARPVCFPRSLQDKKKLDLRLTENHFLKKQLQVSVSQDILWTVSSARCSVGMKMDSGVMRLGKQVLEPLLEIHHPCTCM